jgi:hypothetical protein
VPQKKNTARINLGGAEKKLLCASTTIFFPHKKIFAPAKIFLGGVFGFWKIKSARADFIFQKPKTQNIFSELAKKKYFGPKFFFTPGTGEKNLGPVFFSHAGFFSEARGKKSSVAEKNGKKAA